MYQEQPQNINANLNKKIQQKEQQNANQSLDLYDQLQLNKQFSLQNNAKQTLSSNEHSETSRQTSEQGDVQDQYPSFQIIGKQSPNQTLMVKLYNSNAVWHKGQVLFASHSIKQREQAEDLVKGIFQAFKIWNGPPKMLINQGSQLEYYVLSKQQPTNGKILFLHQQIYKQRFYVNITHLLATNSSFNLKNHPQLKNLKLLTSTINTINSPNSYEQPMKLLIALQCTKDTSIIQKNLGPGQYLYLPNAKIIAMSEHISYKWQRKHRLIRLAGPGYVFFQPQSRTHLILRNRQIVLANIFLILLILVLYWVQFMFLA